VAHAAAKKSREQRLVPCKHRCPIAASVMVHVRSAVERA
jgi:hypothetical protein